MLVLGVDDRTEELDSDDDDDDDVDEAEEEDDEVQFDAVVLSARRLVELLGDIAAAIAAAIIAGL